MLSSYKIYSLHEFTQDKKMATVLSDGKAIPPMKMELKFYSENYSYIVLYILIDQQTNMAL
jgi:hypothetical protein